MIGYYIGGYFFMVAIFCGAMGGVAAFNLFAGAGVLFCVLQWIMS